MDLDACIARLRAAVVTIELSGDPTELDTAMSRLSEDMWSAGWAAGCEFTFWDWIASENYEHLPTHALLRLAVMAKAYNGWWTCEKEEIYPRFISLDEWQKRFDARKAEQEDADEQSPQRWRAT